MTVVYSFSMFEKAGIEPNASAVMFGIENDLLPASAASEFEEWMIEHRGIEGSNEILVADEKDEALAALQQAGYSDDGRGSGILRYAALASLDSEGQSLLVDIERVYADFGYPADMEPFVYYMPAEEENPSPEALLERFRAFLPLEKKRLELR